MARTDNLTNFLTDVANAIREKTGEAGTIYARDFDTKISSISGNSESEIITRLPNRYQEVEYIESIDYNNYIDTGVVFPDVKKVRYEFKVKMPSDIRGQAYWGCFMNGGYNGGTLYENRYYVAGDNTLNLALEANGIYEGYAYTDTNTKSGAFYANNGEIDETLTYTSGGGLPYSDRAPFCIFCQGTPSGSGINYYNGSKLRVYYFRIYQDDVIVRDFVPAYKKEYNTIGLYDLVNDVFYANQGYGVLEKGEDIYITATPKVDLNIFVQDTEPETKDGLWLKTDSKYDYIVAEPYIESTTVMYTEQEPSSVKLIQGSGAQLGDYIYYFGGWGTSDNKTESYKYHIPTNTYTKLPNVPGPVEWGTEGVVIGTNIYFGGTHANTYFYKFDTLTDTYTQLAQSPVQLYGATMVVTPDQRYIYTFGGIYDYNYKPYYRCRYDVANNTWTYTRDNPIQLGGAAAFVHGDAAYFLCARLFTSWTNVAVAPKTYRFNFATETWTVLGGCPQDCCCWCGSVVGDDIYFLSNAITNSPEDGAGRFYKYNVPTDTYTRLDDAPISSYGSRIIAWLGDNQFLLLGCDGDEKRNLIAKIPVPEHDVYNKNTIIVWENINNRNYQSPQVRLYNFGSSISGFNSINNFYVHDITYQTADGEDIDTYEAYYGDGVQWLKLEN